MGFLSASHRLLERVPMKILLVNPAKLYADGCKMPSVDLPLGLLYVAAAIRQDDHEVELLDCQWADRHPEPGQPDFIRLGMNDQQIEDAMLKFTPDVVGVSIPYTAQLPMGLVAIRLARKCFPQAHIIAGGPHCSVAGIELIETTPELDSCIVGEGELPFRDVLKSLQEGGDFRSVQNIVYRNNEGKGTKNESRPLLKNLDELPFPAYDMVDMERYLEVPRHLQSRATHKRKISMFTSRGCPYNCNFCSIHLHMGKPFRGHSTENVLEHIEILVNKYKVGHLAFEDDNFTFDLDRCKAIMRGVDERNLRFTWDTPNGVRADKLDEEMLLTFKRSGCKGLILGVESGVQETLDKIVRKKLDLKIVVEKAALLKKVGIPTGAFYIVGLPGETKAAMKASLDFALMMYRKYDVEPMLSVATPLIGTRMHTDAVANGHLIKDMTPENLAQATHPVRGKGMFKTDEFGPEDIKVLVAYFNTALIPMQIRKRPFNAMMRALRNPKEAMKLPLRIYRMVAKTG